jgi:predicted kinase
MDAGGLSSGKLRNRLLPALVYNPGSMPGPLLVIVTGLPCTGKTTLALRLAGDFGLPFVNKDGLKERLFDRLGWQDRAWSQRLGLASYDLLYYFLEGQLQAGRSCIVESNFKAQIDAPKFLALKDRYPFYPFQIFCRADGAVLLERFRLRSKSGIRHPGHVDHLNDAEFQRVFLAGDEAPLPLGGELLTVDTTDFDSIDYAGIAATLAATISILA